MGSHGVLAGASLTLLGLWSRRLGLTDEHWVAWLGEEAAKDGGLHEGLGQAHVASAVALFPSCGPSVTGTETQQGSGSYHGNANVSASLGLSAIAGWGLRKAASRPGWSETWAWLLSTRRNEGQGWECGGRFSWGPWGPRLVAGSP